MHPVTANDFNERGNYYLDRSEYDAAIEDYTQAIELERLHAYAYYNRGWLTSTSTNMNWRFRISTRRPRCCLTISRPFTAVATPTTIWENTTKP
ncbi:MAG: tetratricopeptide repeat protein [Hyphomicrobiales bacterium]|nr:tetratricopeptide repeat protein [Hyphomicrobiales bacterium]MCP4999962.1 tetratricopeptide repeat protein [Hyphomicrobiales bacterium]